MPDTLLFLLFLGACTLLELLVLGGALVFYLRLRRSERPNCASWTRSSRNA